MKGGTQRRMRPSLAFQLHMDKRRKLVKKVNRQAYREALARHNRENVKDSFITNFMKKVTSFIADIRGRLTRLFSRKKPWKTRIQFIFRTHTPRVLSPEERADRIAHRKQIRHNRQRLINTRGYA